LKLLLCGHGYLGRAISRVFRADLWDVTAVARSTAPGDGHGCGAAPGSVSDEACGSLTEISGDLADEEAVTALARRIPRPDFIVHCASSSRGGPEAYRSVFLDGCRNLLDSFPGTPLLFTSSTSVYAQIDGSTVDEDSPAEPERETGRILLETEGLVIDHGGIVTRLAGIYGSGRSVILQRFLAGEAVIEEDGRRYLNQIHRDDAARAIHHLASLGGEFRPARFNLTDSRPLSQIECYTALAEMFGRPLPPSGPRDPNRKRGWTHKRVSNARLVATGWKPAIPCFLDAAADVARSLDLT
jgi:nucleoside-diphosphate-sugar epimerase